MQQLFVSRDWRDSFERGEVIEQPDTYHLVATYGHDGQRWHVLHRVDRSNWNAVVDCDTFHAEWVTA